MKDLDEAEDGAPERNGLPVGAVLRAFRERRGLTIEAIAMETRIPVASLRNIEEGRFEELPAQVFVRGFLRAYARSVGADPIEVIRLYENAQGPSRPPKASRWPGVFRMRRRSRLGLLLAFVVFAALVGLLVTFVFRR